jgi:hypothetical protein
VHTSVGGGGIHLGEGDIMGNENNGGRRHKDIPPERPWETERERRRNNIIWGVAVASLMLIVVIIAHLMATA